MRVKAYESAKYMPFGGSALVVEFGDEISEKINRKVIALDNAIQKAQVAGVEELVPTYRSLLVRYTPLRISYEQLVFSIKDIEKTVGAARVVRRSRRVTVPVVYGGEYGPDLGYVAKHHGLTEERVIALHSKREYRVFMIGFVAGFPYLGEVADEIATPRLKTPRLRVPAGSVGIAERQTGIYPCEAPGGWRIIGRTPLRMFDPSQDPPTLMRPGEVVYFRPISEREFKTIEKTAFEGMRRSSLGE